MHQNQDQKLKSLPQITNAELGLQWQKHHGTNPPCAPKNLLIRALAYRIQEKSHGGLTKKALQQIRQLIREFQAGSPFNAPTSRQMKLGTRLLREWQGQSYEVTVMDGGFAYRGKRYSSLSEIARLITGTRWSGPAFFGLKQARKRSP